MKETIKEEQKERQTERQTDRETDRQINWRRGVGEEKQRVTQNQRGKVGGKKEGRGGGGGGEGKMPLLPHRSDRVN